MYILKLILKLMSKINFNWSQVLKAVGTLIISIISAITITSCVASALR